MNKIINIGTGAVLFATFVVATTAFANADVINRQLQLGMSGSDVGVMQTFFAKDVTIYPQGLVTNFFGNFTKAAVMRFQTKNGISAVGRVGPATLPVLNAQIAAGGNVSTGSAGVAPISNVSISNQNGGTVKLNWSTPIASRAVVYYSTAPLTTYESDNAVSISGLTANAGNYQSTQSLQLTGLQPATTYYYSIYTTDQGGNVNMTWPTTFRVN